MLYEVITMAVNELRVGQSEVVICGGADVMNDIFMYMCFSKTPALSFSGDCRPFDARADGTMLGEGLGFVITSYSIHYTKLYDTTGDPTWSRSC